MILQRLSAEVHRRMALQQINLALTYTGAEEKQTEPAVFHFSLGKKALLVHIRPEQKNAKRWAVRFFEQCAREAIEPKGLLTVCDVGAQVIWALPFRAACADRIARCLSLAGAVWEETASSHLKPERTWPSHHWPTLKKNAGQ